MTRLAPLRLAFTHIPRRLWAGGYNYQSNLFASLSQFRPGEFAPVLFAGNRDDDADLAPLAAIPGVEIVRSAAFEGRAGLAAALALGLDREAVAEFRTQRIDAVFEAARFLAGVCPIRRSAGFRICNIAVCLNFSPPSHDGVARSVSAFRSHRGGPLC